MKKAFYLLVGGAILSAGLAVSAASNDMTDDSVTLQYGIFSEAPQAVSEAKAAELPVEAAGQAR